MVSPGSSIRSELANVVMAGELQPLADIDEFCGKIMVCQLTVRMPRSDCLPGTLQACKDVQRDPDFMVVARLEAFITGCLPGADPQLWNLLLSSVLSLDQLL